MRLSYGNTERTVDAASLPDKNKAIMCCTSFFPGTLRNNNPQ